jgi:hypothetical protein
MESWDTIIAAGWGPACAAGGVLMSLREYPDLESARWYWAQLREMSGGWADDPANAPLVNESFAPTVLRKLWELLTDQERELLE